MDRIITRLGLNDHDPKLLHDRRGTTFYKIDDTALKITSGLMAGREGEILRLLGAEFYRDHGWDEQRSWLTLRWIDGTSLWDTFEPAYRGDDSTTSRRRMLTVAADTATELATLHAAGWSHGDLQPDHIICEGDTTAIIDLACAQGPADVPFYPHRGRSRPHLRPRDRRSHPRHRRPRRHHARGRRVVAGRLPVVVLDQDHTDHLRRPGRQKGSPAGRHRRCSPHPGHRPAMAVPGLHRPRHGLPGRRPRRPAHRQGTRRRPPAGRYAFAEKLPTEDDLAHELGTTRAVVNNALKQLNGEGYIRADRGKGTFVTKLIEPLVRDAMERYRAASRTEGGGRGAFDASVRSRGMTPRSDVTVTQDLQPPTEVAEILGEGLTVRRARRVYADDIAFQLADSYIPTSIADAANLTSTDSGPGGMLSWLAEAGFAEVDFEEDLLVRTATDQEAEFFGFKPGQQVVQIIHVGRTAQSLPVEVCVHVMPPHLWRFKTHWSIADQP